MFDLWTYAKVYKINQNCKKCRQLFPCVGATCAHWKGCDFVALTCQLKV